MYKIKIIKSPKLVYFEKNDRKEMESIVSITGETLINGINIIINSEENNIGAEYTYRDINNKKIKFVGNWDFDSKNDIAVDEDVYEILEKLAVANLCNELGQDGEEFTSEEVISWDI
jgi:hypothetical protein